MIMQLFSLNLIFITFICYDYNLNLYMYIIFNLFHLLNFSFHQETEKLLNMKSVIMNVNDEIQHYKSVILNF